VSDVTCARRTASYMGMVVGGSSAWVHNPLGIFCFCAATTHLLSALTHIYPDSVALVKSLPFCAIAHDSHLHHFFPLLPLHTRAFFWHVFFIVLLHFPSAAASVEGLLGSV
jgi:hypothetical protein